MHLFTNVQLASSVKSDGKGKIDLSWNQAKVLIKDPKAFTNDLKE